MNGHTPGPWIARKSKWGDLCIHAPTIEHETGLDYIIVQDVGGDSTDVPKYGTPEANARLIAAAPELLAMCQRILDHPLIHITGDVEIPLKRAIAKATGGQP